MRGNGETEPNFTSHRLSTAFTQSMIGGLVHANFIEAVLQHRTTLPVPEWTLESTVVVLALISAVVLALLPGLGMKILMLGGITALLVVAQFVTLNVLGVFFDGGAVLLGVWLHSIGEWVFEHLTSGSDEDELVPSRKAIATGASQ
jgi:CHASE2 domain-containing sensor protein